MSVKLASDNEYWHLKTGKVNCKAEELILLWLWGEYESDLRNNEYYLSSGKIRPEEQKIQVYRGFELMTSAIPVQCSTKLANKPSFW